jgi:hypothetical protein
MIYVDTVVLFRTALNCVQRSETAGNGRQRHRHRHALQGDHIRGSGMGSSGCHGGWVRSSRRTAARHHPFSVARPRSTTSSRRGPRSSSSVVWWAARVRSVVLEWSSAVEGADVPVRAQAVVEVELLVGGVCSGCGGVVVVDAE